MLTTQRPQSAEPGTAACQPLFHSFAKRGCQPGKLTTETVSVDVKVVFTDPVANCCNNTNESVAAADVVLHKGAYPAVDKTKTAKKAQTRIQDAVGK
jgi:hypothetical protein